MKHLSIIIFVICSFNLFAQWTDIGDKAYKGFFNPQMLDSLYIYCMTGDTVAPYNRSIIGTKNGGQDWEIIIRSFGNPIELIKYYSFLSKDSLVFVTHRNTIYFSTDGGKTNVKSTNAPGGGVKNLPDVLFTNKYTGSIILSAQSVHLKWYATHQNFDV